MKLRAILLLALAVALLGIAAAGAYRLAAPAAPADTSGCCCKGYLPILRR